MATQANKGVNDIPQGAAEDTLFDLASDLEGDVGKVQCLDALLGRMAEDAGTGEDALILHHLRFTVHALYQGQRAIVERLYDKARAEKAGRA